MAQPSKKSEPINRTLDAMSSILFGTSRTDSIQAGTCVSCNDVATEFRDTVSSKEFTISGLCQPCQDSVFGA